MKYKTGDMVTVPLNLMTAKQLNEGGSALLHPEDIVEHVSAPDPIVGYVNVYKEGFGDLHRNSKPDQNYGGFLTFLKITYDPSTNTATAEVVND